ncbi:MAG: hypothetical protein P4L99_27810 [Chthoniobacter sp.]|nr:hypothetical protein [Chthoniobacter sp.]
MNLRVATEIHPKNLAGLRAILSDLSNGHVIDLTRETETGRLAWQRQTDGVIHAIHITVPACWLDDPCKVTDLQRAARQFSTSVLSTEG